MSSDFAEILPRLGHRNWVAVVDAAYPEMIAPGVTTTLGPNLETVLETLSEAKHVRFDAFVDAELEYLQETDCPGINAFRADLARLLHNIAPTRMPHTDLIAMLDRDAQTFRVVVVKTPIHLPYTSVFLRLECGYWDAAAEERLRTQIERTEQL